MVVNLFRERVVQPPAIKAASIQGLPNEVQLIIIDMLFSDQDQVLTSVSPGVSPSHPLRYRVAPFTCIQDLRRTVIGLARIWPHLRPHVLSILRTELEALERNYRLVKRAGRIDQRNQPYYSPWTRHPFLEKEMYNVMTLMTYLETGHLSWWELKDVPRTTLPIMARAFAGCEECFQVPA